MMPVPGWLRIADQAAVPRKARALSGAGPPGHLAGERGALAARTRRRRSDEQNQALRVWHADQMQWHWGNIGSAAAGLAALIAAVFAVTYALAKRQGPAWLQAVRDRERAQAQAAREQADLAHEQTEQIRLDRRRSLLGWSPGTVSTYGVALVTSAEEMDQARDELIANGPSDYVILRVAESDQKYGNVNRAQSLRQLIQAEGLVSRAPTAGEREALETGLEALGIPH
jgi:hypothetical protein